MARYSKCPYCGRSTNGLDIYVCRICGRIACYYEGMFGFEADGCWHNNSKCPNCGEHNSMRKIGKVWKD